MKEEQNTLYPGADRAPHGFGLFSRRYRGCHDRPEPRVRPPSSPRPWSATGPCWSPPGTVRLLLHSGARTLRRRQRSVGRSGGRSVVAYKLIGTIEGKSFSGAVLEDSTGQAFYRIHQKLPDGSAIVKVMRDKVSLQRSEGSTVDLQVVDDTKIVNVQNDGRPSGRSRTASTWWTRRKCSRAPKT